MQRCFPGSNSDVSCSIPATMRPLIGDAAALIVMLMAASWLAYSRAAPNGQRNGHYVDCQSAAPTLLPLCCTCIREHPLQSQI